MVAIVAIILSVILHRLYHKYIKRTPTVRFEKLALEYLACLMISMYFVGQFLG